LLGETPATITCALVKYAKEIREKESRIFFIKIFILRVKIKLASNLS